MARIVEPMRRAWPGAIGEAVVGLMALVMQVAQAQDSLAAPTQDSNAVVDARPPALAALAKPPEAERISIQERPPRTEVEFLARYGTSDSARALIRWWFKRRRENAHSAGALGGMFVVGGVMTAKLLSKTTVTEAIALGPTAGLLFWVGGLGGTFTLAKRPGLSRARLAEVLRQHELLGSGKWRRILAND